MGEKDNWLEALEQITRMAATAQQRFEETMASSQARFLETLEHSQRALVELANARAAHTGADVDVEVAPDANADAAIQTIASAVEVEERKTAPRSSSPRPRQLEQRTLEPITTSTPRVDVLGLTRPIAITPDRSGLYLELSDALLEAGLAPHIVQRGEPIPRAAGVVLWCEALVGAEDTDEANALVRRAIEKFASLEAHLARGSFIALRDTGGDLGWDATELASAPFGAIDGLALAKSIASEDGEGGAAFFSIDVDTRRPQAEVAKQITRLLIDGIPQSGCAALSGVGGRAPGWHAVSHEEPSEFEHDGVALFTGGAPPDSLVRSFQDAGARTVRAAIASSALATRDDLFNATITLEHGDSMALYHALEEERRALPILTWVHTLEDDPALPFWEEDALEDTIWSAVAALGCTMTDALERVLILDLDPGGGNKRSIMHTMHAGLLRAMARVERARRGMDTDVRFVTHAGSDFDGGDHADMLHKAALGKPTSGIAEDVELRWG